MREKPEKIICIDLLYLVGELECLLAGEELHHLLRLHDVTRVEDHAPRLEEGHRREVPVKRKETFLTFFPNKIYLQKFKGIIHKSVFGRIKNQKNLECGSW